MTNEEALHHSSRGPRSSVWTVPAAVVIVVAAAVAYANSFSGPFIFDNKAEIEDNSAIRQLWPLGPIFRGPRPVADLTFAVNYAIGGLHVTGYHLVNIAVHILAALALFGIVRRTLTMPLIAGRFDDAAATLLGFCAALIWMVHPLQTEAVNYVVQRAESLMGLFYLLTLYALIRAVSSPQPATTQTDANSDRENSKARKVKEQRRFGFFPFASFAFSRFRGQNSVVVWSVIAVAACALGMGCKQVMVTAPAALLLYDRTFIAGSFREALRRQWGFYLALAATWLILAHSILAAFSPHPDSAGFALAGVTPLAYARSELGVVLRYLELAFRPTGLCLDYSWPVAVQPRQFVPGAIVVGGLLAVTLWAVVRRPKWGFAGAWFFLLLAPTSSVLPISDLAFEHRMYLPLAAPVVAAVVAACLAAERLLRRPGESQEARKRLALGITVLLALCAAAGLGVMTLRRNAQYRSEISIWENATRKRPENPRAWSNLGNAYANASRYSEAIRSCDKALEVNPSFPPAYAIRGLAYAGIGRLTEAIRDYDKAIALKPDYAAAYNNRGFAYAGIGRLTEAIRDCDKAIELKPDFAAAYDNRGVAYARAGRSDEALRDYDEALKLNPDNAKAYNNRGNALADAKRLSEAIRDYDKAIALKPDFAEAYNNRGGVYAQSARLAEALRDFDKAVALKPDYAGAYRNRAMLHYERKEYAEALADAKMCEKLGGRPDPGFVNTLIRAAEQRSTLAP